MKKEERKKKEEKERKKKKKKKKKMPRNFWLMVCTLWTVAGLFYGCHCGGPRDDSPGQRRPIRKDRRRGGSPGSAGAVSDRFRADAPLDPLFTDQQEIRLSFKKVLITFHYSLIRMLGSDIYFHGITIRRTIDSTAVNLNLSCVYSSLMK